MNTKTGTLSGAYSVRNPRTPKQVAQRNKFSTAVEFLQKITPVIQNGFKSYSGRGMSSFNAAMSYNLTNAVIDNAGVPEIDYSNVLISRGKLYRPKSGVVAVTDGEIQAGWDVDFSLNGNAKDKVTIVAFNGAKKEAVYEANAGMRAEGFAAIEFPEYWKGDTAEVYVSLTSEDDKLVADSLYVGQVEIPAL